MSCSITTMNIGKFFYPGLCFFFLFITESLSFQINFTAQIQASVYCYTVYVTGFWNVNLEMMNLAVISFYVRNNVYV